MSNRTLVELNHDHCPDSDAALLAWARKLRDYLRSGDKRDLPPGVTFKHSRHHSDADPMEGRGDVAGEGADLRTGRGGEFLMTAPVRVQLRRVRGWRMPENAVKVDRTTQWGNRWAIGTRSNTLGRDVETVEEAVDLYRRLAWPEEHHRAWVRERLRGKNLACWCPLDRPCHADVLLEIANG